MHGVSTTDEATALVGAAREGLRRLADPTAAPQMQRYMRSEMPFLGVPTPPRRTLLRELVADHPVGSPDALDRAVRTLWDEATYREERYVALALTGHRRYARWLVPPWLPLYQHWIVAGAWWDYVDEIASRRIGPLLREHPATVEPVIRGWVAGDDIWLRRTAIICQLLSKERTDLALLADSIEAAIDEPEFFLRKGIGWALRQHARIDPDWVRAFVAAHPRLSPLSRREALKHIA
ncbi:DNA alkylation repair protein [Pseudonocardia eucalypti]|uniref:DNA alkylation repair protein n=1 Tax=Pseudonocardia eucalypti TaxID=648755 RepID=UPI003CD06F97